MQLKNTIKLYLANYSGVISLLAIVLLGMLIIGVQNFERSEGFLKVKIDKFSVAVEWDGNHKIAIARTKTGGYVSFLYNRTPHIQVEDTVCIQQLTNLLGQSRYVHVNNNKCN